MARMTIDLDDDACQRVMDRFGLTTPDDAVNLALRRCADQSMTLEEANAMAGTGWDGDLEEMRADRNP